MVRLDRIVAGSAGLVVFVIFIHTQSSVHEEFERSSSLNKVSAFKQTNALSYYRDVCATRRWEHVFQIKPQATNQKTDKPSAILHE